MLPIKFRTRDCKFLGPVVFLLLFFTSNAYSLSWNDQEWSRSQCPNNIQGEWIAESHSPLAGGRMDIKSQAVLITFDDGKTKNFRYQSNPLLTKDRQFVEFEISDVIEGGKHPRFFRIRPHLVRSYQESVNDEASPSQCLIKVFRYASKKDASLNRYLNWDIYQKIK